ncbi:hypothetical protein HK105_200976 [Polyrhizophydium stewartii]|uniref:C2H2-type domain-containing protein n=1 Tax=Polyrhizophydium stewartii TaxID=2732419 RepID=A0ABR4NIH7_9FUNG
MADAAAPATPRSEHAGAAAADMDVDAAPGGFTADDVDAAAVLASLTGFAASSPPTAAATAAAAASAMPPARPPPVPRSHTMPLLPSGRLAGPATAAATQADKCSADADAPGAAQEHQHQHQHQHSHAHGPAHGPAHAPLLAAPFAPYLHPNQTQPSAAAAAYGPAGAQHVYGHHLTASPTPTHASSLSPRSAAAADAADRPRTSPSPLLAPKASPRADSGIGSFASSASSHHPPPSRWPPAADARAHPYDHPRAHAVHEAVHHGYYPPPVAQQHAQQHSHLPVWAPEDLRSPPKPPPSSTAQQMLRDQAAAGGHYTLPPIQAPDRSYGHSLPPPSQLQHYPAAPAASGVAGPLPPGPLPHPHSHSPRVAAHARHSPAHQHPWADTAGSPPLPSSSSAAAAAASRGAGTFGPELHAFHQQHLPAYPDAPHSFATGSSGQASERRRYAQEHAHHAYERDPYGRERAAHEYYKQERAEQGRRSLEPQQQPQQPSGGSVTPSGTSSSASAPQHAGDRDGRPHGVANRGRRVRTPIRSLSLPVQGAGKQPRDAATAVTPPPPSSSAASAPTSAAVAAAAAAASSSSSSSSSSIPVAVIMGLAQPTKSSNMSPGISFTSKPVASDGKMVVDRRTLMQTPALWRRQTKRSRNSEGAAELFRFGCTMCDKAFTRKYNLEAHILSHNNIKPFPCTYEGCGEAFVRKYDLNRHVQTVHERNVFGPCPFCNRMYSRADSYRKHVRLEERMHNAVNGIMGGAAGAAGPGGIVKLSAEARAAAGLDDDEDDEDGSPHEEEDDEHGDHGGHGSQAGHSHNDDRNGAHRHGHDFGEPFPQADHGEKSRHDGPIST